MMYAKCRLLARILHRNSQCFAFVNKDLISLAELLKVMCPCKYSSFAGGMASLREISCDN